MAQFSFCPILVMKKASPKIQRRPVHGVFLLNKPFVWLKIHKKEEIRLLFIIIGKNHWLNFHCFLYIYYLCPNSINECITN